MIMSIHQIQSLPWIFFSPASHAYLRSSQQPYIYFRHHNLKLESFWNDYIQQSLFEILALPYFTIIIINSPFVKQYLKAKSKAPANSRAPELDVSFFSDRISVEKVLLSFWTTK